jgi:hypothetical protein
VGHGRARVGGLGLALIAFDRVSRLDLADLSVDGAITKAPAARPPDAAR